jgi:MFS family permease
MSGHRPRVFYGWWVVIAAALGLCLGSPPILVFSFAVFLGPLSQEFHTGRAAISLAFTLHNLISAVSAPLIGLLVDRYGARRVVLPATVIFGSILVLSKILTANLWQFYAFYLTLGVIGSGMSPVPYGNVVSHWFDRRRGLGLGLMMFGLGFGAMVMPSLAQRLIAMFGWRVAYAAVGSGILLISAPVVAAFLRESPEKMGLLPDGVARASSARARECDDLGLSWHDAWHSPTFWLMVSAFFLVGASVHACVLHTAAILTDLGSTAQAAALASSLVGVALLIGRVGSGYLLDRFFGPRIAAIFFGAVAIGIALLWIGNSRELGFTGAFLVGLGMGAEVDIIAYLTSRYFGLRAFGEIYGYAFGAFALAGGIGTFLMGFGFDLTGSYRTPLVGFFAATLVAIVLMTRLGPYRYSARGAEDTETLQLQPEETT